MFLATASLFFISQAVVLFLFIVRRAVLGDGRAQPAAIGDLGGQVDDARRVMDGLPEEGPECFRLRVVGEREDPTSANGNGCAPIPAPCQPDNRTLGCK